MVGLQPQHAGRGGLVDTDSALEVLPSAYVINPKLIPEVNTDLLTSVETISPSPLTIQYVINPKAVWSDGVPVTADDFIYAWKSQKGDGADSNGRPTWWPRPSATGTSSRWCRATMARR